MSLGTGARPQTQGVSTRSILLDKFRTIHEVGSQGGKQTILESTNGSSRVFQKNAQLQDHLLKTPSTGLGLTRSNNRYASSDFLKREEPKSAIKVKGTMKAVQSLKHLNETPSNLSKRDYDVRSSIESMGRKNLEKPGSLSKSMANFGQRNNNQRYRTSENGLIMEG